MDNTNTDKFQAKQSEVHKQQILKLLSDISSSLKTLVYYGAGKTPGGHASTAYEPELAAQYVEEMNRFKTVIKEELLKQINLKET